MKSIQDKVKGIELVDWRSLLPIQPDNFKELTKEAYNKLKTSLLNNSFISPFVVWQAPDKKLYTIDGVHRQKVLNELINEGVKVPDKLPAVFLDCASRKEAAKLLLVYSSAYAKTTLEGLDEFLHLEELNIEDVKLEIDIPSIDLKYFEDPNKEHENKEPVEVKPIFEVVIECNNETEQETIYNQLNEMGMKCRVLTL